MAKTTTQESPSPAAETVGMTNQPASLLVGYVRKSNAGGALKLSVNVSAFHDCRQYTTSDGQAYVPLVVSLSALHKVIAGERSVTTMSQLLD